MFQSVIAKSATARTNADSSRPRGQAAARGTKSSGRRTSRTNARMAAAKKIASVSHDARSAKPRGSMIGIKIRARKQHTATDPRNARNKRMDLAGRCVALSRRRAKRSGTSAATRKQIVSESTPSNRLGSTETRFKEIVMASRPPSAADGTSMMATVTRSNTARRRMRPATATIATTQSSATTKVSIQTSA